MHDPMTDHASGESEEFWEDFYREGRGAWSGNANGLLVEEIDGAPPGTALDLGCGQGDDAIWLASRGWNVTAVDISATALERAVGRAAAAGVADAISWERHDLAVSFPAGSFDLVTTCYLHSPVDMPRAEILRSAAAAVAPGGTLLIVGHAGSPSWADHDPGVHFPTTDDVLAELSLDPAEWTIERTDVVDRPMPDPDGNPASRPDNIVRARRRSLRRPLNRSR